jgi:hypothetical protein
MKLYKSIEDFYLSHFYLVIPLATILLSCVGGFAVYYITLKGMSLFNFTLMFLCVAGAMFLSNQYLGPNANKNKLYFFILWLAS